MSVCERGAKVQPTRPLWPSLGLFPHQKTRSPQPPGPERHTPAQHAGRLRGLTPIFRSPVAFRDGLLPSP